MSEHATFPKAILFVDDEERLLQGIQRMLRPMRHVWDMEFASSGQAALEKIQSRCFDVIVSDMRMPEIDGATLLKRAREQCPYSIRMILSGQAKQENVLQAIQVAHQYLSKPCDIESLKQRISRACDIRDLLANHIVKEALSGLVQVPSLPTNYALLRAELQEESPSLSTIEHLTLSDPGITAKLLQVANSAFFGPAKKINDPLTALYGIGIEGLRSLAFDADAFSIFESDSSILSMDKLIAHSHGVIAMLEKIFKIEEFSAEERQQARTAGLLHEIGRLLLATILPEKYREVNQLIVENGISQDAAELEVFGKPHPEIGAYLLALWGVPQEIVQAVAFHHSPQECPHSEFNVLTALHVANVLEDELYPRSRFESKLQLNRDLMRQLNRAETVEDWLRKVSQN